MCASCLQTIHKELEAKVAEFHGREDAILYASCFDANAGIFETLLTKDDAVLSDALNHASIIDGIRLCKAQKHRFKHRDMEGKKRETGSKFDERVCSKLPSVAADIPQWGWTLVFGRHQFLAGPPIKHVTFRFGEQVGGEPERTHANDLH